MGQFLDHDMTFDTSSRLGQPTNPHKSPAARRPFFDLDSVYGDGPVGSSLLTRCRIGRSFASRRACSPTAGGFYMPRDGELFISSGNQVLTISF